MCIVDTTMTNHIKDASASDPREWQGFPPSPERQDGRLNNLGKEKVCPLNIRVFKTFLVFSENNATLRLLPIIRVAHYVVKLPRAPEFPEKLAVEGGLRSPSCFRPEHVRLRVSSNSSCLGMGYPSNSVMGKEEKHKTAQEGEEKKLKVPATEERSQLSQGKLIHGEKAPWEEVVSLSFPRCCGLDIVRAHFDGTISVRFVLLLVKLS